MTKFDEYLSRSRREDGCWPWAGPMHKLGYGLSSRPGPPRQKGMAHRMVWEYLVGPIPPGMTIDHVCLNRGCVNPAHMRLLTQSQNVKARCEMIPAAIRSSCDHQRETDANGKLLVCKVCYDAAITRYRERTPDWKAHNTAAKARWRARQKQRNERDVRVPRASETYGLHSQVFCPGVRCELLDGPKLDGKVDIKELASRPDVGVGGFAEANA